MIKHTYPTKFLHSQNFIPIKINPYPQNLSIPTSLSIYSQKILPCSWNIFTHTNKISHMHHEHIHTSPQNKFFTMPILPKSKTKLIQQHYNLPTLSKFHKPPTLSKLYHDKKYNTSKMLQSQHYNMINHTMPQTPTITQQNDNGSPSNFQWSMKQYFSKQRNQRKTHLDVHVRIWNMGLGSWRSPSSSCQSNVRSYFLPWKVRKEDPLEKEDILVQWKMVLKMGFTKNGCVAKVLKNTRI